jgi:hypothetical protein
LLAAVVAEADVGWRVRESHGSLGAGQGSLHLLCHRGVPAQEPVVTESPEITGLAALSPAGVFESRLKVEVLGLVGLVADFEASQQSCQLVLARCQMKVTPSTKWLPRSELMTRLIAVPQVTVYTPAAGGQGDGNGTLLYAGVAEANAMDSDRITVEINPLLPDLAQFPDNSVADIYPFIEFDLTRAGARELALALLSAADGADMLARGQGRATTPRSN